MNEKTLQDITKALKNLRVLTVNIINYYAKIRECSSYMIMEGKYVIDNLSKSFNFDKDYPMKVRNDTDFLRSSPISNYFNFSQKSDPFFIALAEKNNE